MANFATIQTEDENRVGEKEILYYLLEIENFLGYLDELNIDNK
jgi:hypothetical protein